MLYRRFASPSLARREWPEDDSTTNEADCFVLCCCAAAAAAVVDSFAGLNVEKVDTPPRYEELAKSSGRACEKKKKERRGKRRDELAMTTNKWEMHIRVLLKYSYIVSAAESNRETGGEKVR